MHRSIRTILFIVLTGYLALPLSAQDIFLRPHIYFTLPERKPLEAIEIKVHLYYQPKDLFDFSVRWPRFDLSRMDSLYTQSYEGLPDDGAFRRFCNKPRVNEEKKLREEWRKAFGMDLWYPYYKAKEVEEWVKERFSVKVFKFKGKPQFSKNRIVYVFTSRF